MSTKKLKGYYLQPELIKKIKVVCDKANLSESGFIEMSVEHFLSLPESKQRDLIVKFLTKNL